MIIETIDDAYFFLADKTESFWCIYHNQWKEFLFINKSTEWAINLFDISNNSVLSITEDFFEKEFNVVWHPIYLWRIIDLMDVRLKELYNVVLDEEFAKYVYMAKFFIDAWHIKANSLQWACWTEELFNNLIKIIWDFFNEPDISKYKSTVSKEEEIEATSKLLTSKLKKKWMKKLKKNS
jgi:hypothetical protein